MGVPNKINKDNLQLALNAYQSGQSLLSSGNIIGVSGAALRQYCIKHGIARRTRSASMRKLKVNEHFFEQIINEPSAYWLGFILADGTIFNDSLTLALHIKDSNHLEKFKESIGADHLIKHYHYSNQTSRCQISIRRHEIVNDLANLGIYRNKSLTVKPPVEQIPLSLVHHFWRGVIDGDGSICFLKKRPHNSHISLVGSEYVCNAFSVWVKTLDIDSPVVKQHKSIFEVKVFGRIRCRVVLSALYKDATLFLNRKFNASHNLARIGCSIELPRGEVDHPDVAA